jgi:hypothetical protein
MARQKPAADNGSWDYAQELLERGDPAFVDELRRITDGERLGKFAATWFKDKRESSRALLLEYLRRPLNAFRHEALVKRLFKLAEKAGDDEVLAHFLVLFDRSVRRVPRTLKRRLFQTVRSAREARDLAAEWSREGVEGVHHYGWGKQYQVYGFVEEEGFGVPDDSMMWRPADPRELKKPHPIDEKKREDWEARCRLFTTQTRRYLRRRAWRYFRGLGKLQPERYLPAISIALKLYEDADVPDGLALMDCWGLLHALFHHSPALVASPAGWKLGKEHSLAELSPAPYFEDLWKADPQAILSLMKEGRCRPVRQWAVFLLRRDHQTVLDALSLHELFDLLGHEGEEVVALAAELLQDRPGLEDIPVETWLQLLDRANAAALEILCDLIARRLRPERATLEQAVQLASARPLPVARLGFSWLRTRTPQGEADCQTLLGLVDAEAELLRPELMRWLRGVLSASPFFRPEWVLDYLDSRQRDVRAEGWRWLREEPRARDQVDLWQKLLESPHDDVRLLLIAELEDRITGRETALSGATPLDPTRLRLLWATVLLNIHRGSRAKPIALAQLARRLEQKPEEAGALLPILAVALRSIRGPEWRAGLAAVIQLVERRPELGEVVSKEFPELELEVTSAAPRGKRGSK